MNQHVNEWINWLCCHSDRYWPFEHLVTQVVLVSLIFLLLLVMAATPSRAHSVRYALFGAMGLALLALLLSLSKVIPAEGPGASIFWPAGVVLSISLLAKLALANHCASMRDARAVLISEIKWTPLPFQTRALDGLMSQITMSGTPMVLGLKSDWGGGKSVVMDLLQQKLTQDPRQFVTIKLNVWEHENQGDFQFGIVQQLMGHAAVLEQYGWLGFPFWTLVRTWGGIRFNKFNVSVGSASTEGDLALRLPWQGYLEKIIGRQASKGRRIVIVMDEVERASAQSTQEALTLITRSLMLPNVVVVVPYVPDVIAYKAFHPNMIVLDDLRDTASEYFDRMERRKITSSSAIQNEGDAHRVHTSTAAEVFSLLASAFLRRATATQWDAYYSSMSEKYIRTHVRLGPACQDDIEDFLNLNEIKEAVFGLSESEYSALVGWAKVFCDENKIEFQVRWLKGDLINIMSWPNARGMDPRFVLRLALARAGSERVNNG